MTNLHVIKDQYSIPNVALNGKSDHQDCIVMKAKTTSVINQIKITIKKKGSFNQPSIEL